MAKKADIFRIHPAIGVARVGNGEEYVIAPETMAGSPGVDGSGLTGGLPIRAGTKSETVTSSDLRDAAGALKRHAARFRIFVYPELSTESWPRGDGVEVVVGTRIGARTVVDIVWTVHVANKKANWFVLVEGTDPSKVGIGGYSDGRLPPPRNLPVGSVVVSLPAETIAAMNDPGRVKKLTIDPGPRTVRGVNASPVSFDADTAASYFDASSGEVVELKRYPKSFPSDSFADMDDPSGPITTLGEVLTDADGRLLVLGGYGRAAAWKVDGAAPLTDDVNNDQWFDDTSDGPVSATLVFDDGSRAEASAAWVVTTDPAYAPQILNVVSLWDEVYDTWVRQLGLVPDLYAESAGGFQSSYKPSFDDQIAPILKAASLQHWTVNLSQRGMSAHEQIGEIAGSDDPATTVLAGLVSFRNPFETTVTDKRIHADTTLMPLHLGDAGESLLTLRKTQYFMLQRWNEGRGNFDPGAGPLLGPGEFLDKATLVNCLGGRFSPGIDLTFTTREPAIYQQPWQSVGGGPFRIHGKRLDYAKKGSGKRPFLTVGYVPRHVEEGLEPGDMSKFLAIPWHTDYNSCATHPMSPNPDNNRTLFWSWPAQRPVAVYAATDVRWDDSGTAPGFATPEAPSGPVLGEQRWSVRGRGTDATGPEKWGRFQLREDMLDNWHHIGVVLQGAAIDGEGAPLKGNTQFDSWYLEAESQLVDTGLTPVIPFPNLADQLVPFAVAGPYGPDPATMFNPRDLYFKLLNVESHPDVLPDARAYVDAWLAWSQAFSLDSANAPADEHYFDYTEQAFRDRLEWVYQELVDDAAVSDPGADGQYIRTYDDMNTYNIQWAPFNLIDGSWLRKVGRTGPIDDVRTLIYSVFMDEIGDGVVSMNHCNIYLDLCRSIGYYPPPIESRDFAYDPQFLDSAFTVPAFQLAISEFTEDYFPEILGMTVLLEWQVVDLKPTRDLLEYFGQDPHFYVMHIGIDNAVNGHGQRAVDAVCLYLENIRRTAGEAAVQIAWRRIWNGYVAFGSTGSFGQDLVDLITNGPSLREQMLAMIERKATFGSRNHQQHMVGPSRIDEWFADPEGFLDALRVHEWITAGDWQNSRIRALMDFETGPMYRVFTEDEIELWEAYTTSLSAPPASSPVTTPPARAMAALIDQLRPIQRGVSGHVTHTLADRNGVVHPLAWWFEQPTRKLMEALASPLNDVIVPGHPESSRFYMELTAPTGPMGKVFGLPAAAPNHGMCREVLHDWIAAGCPLVSEVHRSLRLNTPKAKRDQHPSGIIFGMGGIH